ncbi:uncharacterized protein LOC116251319 [Nymphaea colorata]|nr:uncharacterized protein LOC116251319 [Nymphaea colorata]
MEDVITDFPPPSRLFFDDLNNFSSLPQPLPSPFLLLSNPNPNAEPSSPLEPSLLIVAVSRPSTFLLHHLRGRALVGTLVLPEFSVAANSLDSSSLDNNSAHLYALDTAPGVLLALIQYQIPPERSSAVAKVVFEKIRPKRVLILSSIQSMNFRGKIYNDERFAFKLETLEQRLDPEGPLVRELSYFPSGSLIEGIAASLLAACQVRKIKGTLVVSWPESQVSVVLLRSVLRNIVGGLDFSPSLETSPFKDVLAESEMYI